MCPIARLSETIVLGIYVFSRPNSVNSRPIGGPKNQLHSSTSLADRAIYFACVNFFSPFLTEQSYLSIYWTDLHDLFTKWKVFA